MAIQTQIITGRLSEPDGDPITNGTVRFTLSRYDATDNGIIAASRKIEAPLDVDGSITLDLWPNTAGLRGTSYLVELLSPNGNSVVETYGRIQIGEDGPYSLADLIRQDVPQAGNTFWSAISEAEYNTKIAQLSGFATAASDSADLSQAWAGEAEASADRVDLGALDDAVAATSADVALTNADAAQTALDRIATGEDVLAAETARAEFAARAAMRGQSQIIPSEPPKTGWSQEIVRLGKAGNPLDAGKRFGAFSPIDKLEPRQFFQFDGRSYILAQIGAPLPPTSYAQAGGLFYSDDNKNWMEAVQTPIGRVEQSWQGNRFLARYMHKDYETGLWYLYFGGSGGENVPGVGIRCDGVAVSDDFFLSYTIKPDPVLLVEHGDILDWAQDGSDRCSIISVLYEESDGYYYAFVSAGTELSDRRNGVLRSRSPIGGLDGEPWEGGDWNLPSGNLDNPITDNVINSVVKSGGRYWMLTKQGGGSEFRIYVSEHPTEKFQLWSDGVIFDTDEADQPRFEGGGYLGGSCFGVVDGRWKIFTGPYLTTFESGPGELWEISADYTKDIVDADASSIPEYGLESAYTLEDYDPAAATVIPDSVGPNNGGTVGTGNHIVGNEDVSRLGLRPPRSSYLTERRLRLGVDQSVNLGNTHNFCTSSADEQFSVSLWNARNGSVLSADPYLMSKQEDEDTPQWRIIALGGGVAGIRVELHDQTDGGFIAAQTGPLFDNAVWQHVVVTYDGSGSPSGLRILVNGERSDTSREVSGTYTRMRPNASALTYINGGLGEVGKRMSADFDEIYIWSAVVSPEDAYRLYNKGGGRFLRVPKNLAENGDFNTSLANWVVINVNPGLTKWVWDDGVARSDTTDGSSQSFLQQDMGLLPTERYRLTFEWTRPQGRMFLRYYEGTDTPNGSLTFGTIDSGSAGQAEYLLSPQAGWVGVSFSATTDVVTGDRFNGTVSKVRVEPI